MKIMMNQLPIVLISDNNFVMQTMALHHFTTFSKKYIVQGTLLYNEFANKIYKGK